MKLCKMRFFKILETKTSEANNRKIFSKNCLIYTPDFFIVLLFSSLLILSGFMDFFLMLLLFFKSSKIFWIIFSTASYVRVIFESLVELQSDKSSGCNIKLLQPFYNLPLVILGLHSSVISFMILIETFKNQNTTYQISNCALYPIFHISNKYLSVIKIYCYIYVGLKCIPQLFIISLYIGVYHPTGFVGNVIPADSFSLALGRFWKKIFISFNQLLSCLRFFTKSAWLSTGNILLNILLFSFSISMTIPIRRTPRIFKNFYILIFSAANKFLATICGCCATLVIFMAMFRHVQYYAFLAHLPKIIVWVFPCLILFSTQNITKIQFVVYLFFFPLVFSFIFIHPFQRTWNLYYYFLYLFIGLLDLACLGLWTSVQVTDLTYYSTMRILQFILISCFGLVNGFLKGIKCNLNVEIIKNDDEIIEQTKDESEAGNLKINTSEVSDGSLSVKITKNSL